MKLRDHIGPSLALFVVAAAWTTAFAVQAPQRPQAPPRPQTSRPQPQAATTAKPDSAKPAADASKEPDEGIPITSEAVQLACGTCHESDARGRMSRISYRRTTPEGWQETIRRMVTLNNAQLEPDAAREVVRYLSNHLGLAPEEVAPAAFEVERRLVDYKYAADTETERVCSSCHSMGRVLLQRRTKEEWDLLVAMHRGWYPLVDSQVFRRFGPPPREPGPDGRPPDARHPVEKAADHLKSALPFTTPQWTAWSATMRPARLEGTWALTGSEPGQGPVFGQMTVRAGASPEEFSTETIYTYARTGQTVSRAGRSTIYTGFQWRGRSTVGADDTSTLREVMRVDRDWRTVSGRWFKGGYDEQGLDITLARIGRETLISGVDRPSLTKGSSAQQVRIFGVNLPQAPAPKDIDFGPGVTVTRVASATPGAVAVELDVAADAAPGARDLYLAGSLHRSAIVVFDKVDFIKVTPGWNMARLGGVVFPKMFAQFEAFAFSNGPDGKPDTKDDLDLGVVDARWSLEEYTATFVDDDVAFVGKLDSSTGFFTPADDGPNPQRSGNRNNVGDVWVVAAYQPAGGAPMRARAHLIVTVPLYLRWDTSPAGMR